MEMPILYQYQGEVQQASDNVLQSQRQVDLLKSQIASDVITAYNEVSVARTNIFEFQKNLLPTAAEVSKVARRGYEVGAQRSRYCNCCPAAISTNAFELFDAVVAYQNAWADWKKLSACRFFNAVNVRRLE